MDLTQLPLPSPGDARPQKAEACVVLNAGAGKRKDEGYAAALGDAIARHPGRFAVAVTEGGEGLREAIARAVDGGHPVLVAAGGDGTITAVAEAAVAHGRTLAVVPAGTFNFVARSLGIPDNLDEAVELAARGTARAVPVAEVNGRLFLNNASLGIYPAILREREGIYRRWGRSRFAAYWSVLRTVFGAFHPLHLKVTVDEKVIRVRTPLVFIARSAFQLEHYGLEGAEAVREGRFAVFVAPDAPPLRLVLLALRLALGGLQAGRDVDLVTGTEVIVETSTPRRLLLARDGERTRLSSPLRFRILPDSLRLIVPEPLP